MDNLKVSHGEQKKLLKKQPAITLICNSRKAVQREEKTAFTIDEQVIGILGRVPVQQIRDEYAKTTGTLFLLNQIKYLVGGTNERGLERT